MPPVGTSGCIDVKRSSVCLDIEVMSVVGSLHANVC